MTDQPQPLEVNESSPTSLVMGPHDVDNKSELTKKHKIRGSERRKLKRAEKWNSKKAHENAEDEEDPHPIFLKATNDTNNSNKSYKGRWLLKILSAFHIYRYVNGAVAKAHHINWCKWRHRIVEDNCELLKAIVDSHMELTELREKRKSRSDDKNYEECCDVDERIVSLTSIATLAAALLRESHINRDQSLPPLPMFPFKHDVRRNPGYCSITIGYILSMIQLHDLFILWDKMPNLPFVRKYIGSVTVDAAVTSNDAGVYRPPFIRNRNGKSDGPLPASVVRSIQYTLYSNYLINGEWPTNLACAGAVYSSDVREGETSTCYTTNTPVPTPVKSNGHDTYGCDRDTETSTCYTTNTPVPTPVKSNGHDTYGCDRDTETSTCHLESHLSPESRYRLFHRLQSEICASEILMWITRCNKSKTSLTKVDDDTDISRGAESRGKISIPYNILGPPPQGMSPRRHMVGTGIRKQYQSNIPGRRRGCYKVVRWELECVRLAAMMQRERDLFKDVSRAEKSSQETPFLLPQSEVSHPVVYNNALNLNVDATPFTPSWMHQYTDSWSISEVRKSDPTLDHQKFYYHHHSYEAEDSGFQAAYATILPYFSATVEASLEAVTFGDITIDHSMNSDSNIDRSWEALSYLAKLLPPNGYPKSVAVIDGVDQGAVSSSIKQILGAHYQQEGSHHGDADDSYEEDQCLLRCTSHATKLACYLRERHLLPIDAIIGLHCSTLECPSPPFDDCVREVTSMDTVVSPDPEVGIEETQTRLSSPVIKMAATLDERLVLNTLSSSSTFNQTPNTLFYHPCHPQNLLNQTVSFPRRLLQDIMDHQCSIGASKYASNTMKPQSPASGMIKIMNRVMLLLRRTQLCDSVGDHYDDEKRKKESEAKEQGNSSNTSIVEDEILHGSTKLEVLKSRVCQQLRKEGAWVSVNSVMTVLRSEGLLSPRVMPSYSNIASHSRSDDDITILGRRMDQGAKHDDSDETVLFLDAMLSFDAFSRMQGLVVLMDIKGNDEHQCTEKNDYISDYSSQCYMYFIRASYCHEDSLTMKTVMQSHIDYAYRSQAGANLMGSRREYIDIIENPTQTLRESSRFHGGCEYQCQKEHQQKERMDESRLLMARACPPFRPFWLLCERQWRDTVIDAVFKRNSTTLTPLNNCAIEVFTIFNKLSGMCTTEVHMTDGHVPSEDVVGAGSVTLAVSGEGGQDVAELKQESYSCSPVSISQSLLSEAYDVQLVPAYNLSGTINDDNSTTAPSHSCNIVRKASVVPLPRCLSARVVIGVKSSLGKETPSAEEIKSEVYIEEKIQETEQDDIVVNILPLCPSFFSYSSQLEKNISVNNPKSKGSKKVDICENNFIVQPLHISPAICSYLQHCTIALVIPEGWKCESSTVGGKKRKQLPFVFRRRPLDTGTLQTDHRRTTTTDDQDVSFISFPTPPPLPDSFFNLFPKDDTKKTPESNHENNTNVKNDMEGGRVPPAVCAHELQDLTVNLRPFPSTEMNSSLALWLSKMDPMKPHSEQHACREMADAEYKLNIGRDSKVNGDRCNTTPTSSVDGGHLTTPAVIFYKIQFPSKLTYLNTTRGIKEFRSAAYRQIRAKNNSSNNITLHQAHHSAGGVCSDFHPPLCEVHLLHECHPMSLSYEEMDTYITTSDMAKRQQLQQDSMENTATPDDVNNNDDNDRHNFAAMTASGATTLPPSSVPTTRCFVFVITPTQYALWREIRGHIVLQAALAPAPPLPSEAVAHTESRIYSNGKRISCAEDVLAASKRHALMVCCDEVENAFIGGLRRDQEECGRSSGEDFRTNKSNGLHTLQCSASAPKRSDTDHMYNFIQSIPRLLYDATHPSSDTFETIEFLGDAVGDYCCADRVLRGEVRDENEDEDNVNNSDCHQSEVPHKMNLYNQHKCSVTQDPQYQYNLPFHEYNAMNKQQLSSHNNRDEGKENHKVEPLIDGSEVPDTQAFWESNHINKSVNLHSCNDNLSRCLPPSLAAHFLWRSGCSNAKKMADMYESVVGWLFLVFGELHGLISQRQQKEQKLHQNESQPYLPQLHASSQCDSPMHTIPVQMWSALVDSPVVLMMDVETGKGAYFEKPEVTVRYQFSLSIGLAAAEAFMVSSGVFNAVERISHEDIGGGSMGEVCDGDISDDDSPQ